MQLNELEEATRSKYEEQVIALQLEVKMKQEQLMRVLQEKEVLDRKMKQKLEEVGLSSKQVQREVNEGEQQREEMQR